MKTFTKLKTIIALASAFGLVQTAMGASYLFQTADYVDHEFWVQSPLELTDSGLTGTLNLADVDTDGNIEYFDSKGYDSNVEALTEVELLFAMGGELLNLKLGDQGLTNVNSFLGGNIFVHNFTFNSGFEGVLGLSFVNTGILNWNLSLGQGQGPIAVFGASLAANTEPKSNVPDSGATLALLGLSVLGIAGIKRKLA